MYIHTMEFHSPGKKYEVMKYLGKWMELGNVISDATLAQKDKYYKFSLLPTSYLLFCRCVYLYRSVRVESKKLETDHERGNGQIGRRTHEV